VRVDAFAIRLRPRGNFEAADLGVRLCQSAAGDVYRCYLSVWAPVAALALATYQVAGWLPILVLWWAKPWLDRTILFALSRAAFGQSTRPGDVWREQRQVWWRGLPRTLTVQRLSFWRTFTQPVYQLEGLRGAELRARVTQIRAGRTGAATAILSAFGCAETSVVVGLIALVAWFAPQGYEQGLFMSFLQGGSSTWLDIAGNVTYALAIAFVEPFYAAAGFALYLNRRAELEAWDIEQELRRAFGN
jgi:hypothetical protein